VANLDRVSLENVDNPNTICLRDDHLACLQGSDRYSQALDNGYGEISHQGKFRRCSADHFPTKELDRIPKVSKPALLECTINNEFA
jgi:hypothetical protein